MSESTDGGATCGPRTLVDNPNGVHQWFPWVDHLPDGRLVIAWDQDNVPAGSGEIPANDTFNHVLWIEGAGTQVLSPNVAEGRSPVENIDDSVTHWSGQYVPQSAWPTVCGPEGPDAGKNCNEFHGDFFDYSGMIVDPCGVQQTIPLWIGGRTARSLRRAVELADGWAPFGLRPASFV